MASILFNKKFSFVLNNFHFKDVCGLEHAKDGMDDIACKAYLASYSYDAAINECTFFVYGGCGGNENQFDSYDECEETCKE